MHHANHENRFQKDLVLFLLALAMSLCACGQQGGDSSPLAGEPGLGRPESPASEPAGPFGHAPEPLPESETPASGALPDIDADLSGPEGYLKTFGANCIADQTFQASLSEYEEAVWFVPFSPSKSRPEFYMQIMQDGNVLADITAYVPDDFAGKTFQSLDAVSFYDVNYDGGTDLVLIETYGGEQFAAVYYGYPGDGPESPAYFSAQEQLSGHLSDTVSPLSVPDIRSFLSGGKKNGEFESYQEAYLAVCRLREAESGGEDAYGLIHFDDDDVPELAAGASGYHASLYTYGDGTVYTLMDRWPYGVMGNAGYEYVPRKNSLRNRNSDFAGAILYTSYLTMNGKHSLETVVQIETYQFDDANQNGIPDEDELASLGRYSANYIDGKAASQEECDSYEAGTYEYIECPLDYESVAQALSGA